MLCKKECVSGDGVEHVLSGMETYWYRAAECRSAKGLF